jgi:hypothetical protein
MDGLEIMFDGISVQHAGELLLDQPVSSRRIRNLCLPSYYRCLKDFAFAVIFGGKIITTGTFPAVKEGTPGETLLSRDYFGGKHERRPPDSPKLSQKWESLLDNEEGDDYRAVGSLIASLGQVNSESLAYWTHEVARDVFLYLGSDKSLRNRNAGPDYIYEGRGNFVRFPGLQALVPRPYIEQVVTTIRQKLNDLPSVHSAHDDAIREFVCRNAVAHIGIYRWYSKMGDSALDRLTGLRIPHATRQALPQVEASLWKIREMTTPGLLERMIADSTCREDLRNKLLEASQDTMYDPLREKLARACQLWRLGSRSELDRICADIEVEIHARKISPGQIVVASGNELEAYKNAITTLAIRGAGPQLCMPDLRRVFKDEFADNTPVPTDVSMI